MRCLGIVVVALCCGCTKTPENTKTEDTKPDKTKPEKTTPEKTTAGASTSAAASSPAGKDGAGCGSLFTPPAGATKLCDEHVAGNGAEIHWQSYAHTEDRQTLWRSYQERASPCGASVNAKPPVLEIAKDDMRLELFDASAAGYPKCSVAAAAEHKTVIVVSQKHDR